jgi:hypothetical protein
MQLATASENVLRLVNDWAWFNALRHRPQGEVLQRLQTVWAIQNSGAKGKEQAKAKEAARRGVSLGTINRDLRQYKSHGVRGLADGRGCHVEGLPPAFKTWVLGLRDQHQRSDDGKEVHRRICAALAAWERGGEPIPGYLSPPPRMANGLPRGWSYENLQKYCKPSRYQQSATKQGPKAASQFLPSVLTTRVGSAALSRILFDDQDLDNLLADGQLALSGLKETHRPVSFNALDFYTGCHIGHHLRAVYKDPDEGKKKTLTGKEFVWFVIHILQTVGYRIDSLGTELIFEWGTANGWNNKDLTTLGGLHSFDDALHAICGGHVRANRSGKFNTPLFADMYFRPQSTGNFRFKTWIESSFRLLRTWMQALPGPTGSHQRLNGPEELYGIQHRERQLLTAIADKLPAQHRDLIRHELLSFSQFHELICAIYRAINRRTDHALEGWEECGFTFPSWRPSLPAPGEPDHWFSWAELEAIQDPDRKALMLARLNANRETLIREERLSPSAALSIELERDNGSIRTLPDKVASLLLPREWAVEVTVGSDHTFQLANPLWASSKETYVATLHDGQARWTIDGGKKLMVFHNPFGDGRAHLHNMEGAYLGTIHPVAKAKPFDQESYLLQLGVRSAIKSGHESELRARLSDIARDRKSREAENARILRTGMSAPERRSEAAQRGARTTKDNAMRDALGPAALNPGQFLSRDDAEALQEPFTASSSVSAFDPSQLLHSDD